MQPFFVKNKTGQRFIVHGLVEEAFLLSNCETNEFSYRYASGDHYQTFTWDYIFDGWVV